MNSPETKLSLIKFRNLELIKQLGGQVPDSETLQEWSAKWDSDQVAFLLFESILNSIEQKNFIEYVHSQKLNHVDSQRSPVEIWILSSSNQSLAPWGSHVELFGSWLEELGLDWNELTTLSDNNISQNAELVGEAIQASHSKKIIISLGRGSLEMSYLCRMNEKNRVFDLHSVCGWINIAGSVAGSVKADDILKSSYLSMMAKIKSIFRREYLMNLLMSAKSNPIWRTGEFTSIKQSINVTILPICFEKHIPIFYRKAFEKLRRLGPNDSQSLLADQIIRPGFVYPLWGKVVIDDVEQIKGDLLRVIIAVKNILDKKLGVDFLSTDEQFKAQAEVSQGMLEL